MTTRASDYLDAIDHLPRGATLVFHDVPWEEYEEVLEGVQSRHLRVAYD
jgi:hypothetical protein